VDLFRLLVFVTVADQNGYSAAAKHLHLSQATVSFHVHELERQFKVRLVEYERRAVRLTRAGEEVYRASRAMLQESDRLASSIREIQLGRRGRVSVGASMAFEQAYFFERVVTPFCREHSDTALTLRFGHSVLLAEAVRERELDLAYVIDWRLPAGVRYEPLHEARFTFLVAPQHPLTERDTVSVEDIAEAGLITAPLNSVEWVYYEGVLKDAGIFGARPSLEIDGVQARALAAQAGLGAFGTFYPPYAGEDPYGGLAPLRVDRPLPSVQVGLASRDDGSSHGTARAFADWLREVTRNRRTEVG
jgi:DNA-binding transcriptional LysR family regulator